MRGTIVKRGNKYAFAVDLGYDENGKRVRRWHSGFDRRKDAQAALNTALSKLQSGTYVAPSKVTVGRFLKDWLKQKESTVKANTLHTYEVYVGQLTKALGTRRLQSLSPGEINAFYAAELARGLSPKSVKNAHGVLRKALHDAERWGVIAKNPAALADPPTVKAPQPRVWTAEELRRFLAHVQKHRMFPAWALAASTGVRRSELLGLRWSGVDLDSKTVTVSDTLVRVGGELVLRTHEGKTEAARRTVALDSSTVEVIRQHRLTQVEERLVAGELWQELDLVFCDEVGRPFNPDRFSRTTKREVEAAGVRWVGVHGLRHTWATLALRAGVNPKIVQERLGHANISLTLQVYSHVLPGMQEEAAELVAAQVFE